LAELLFPVRRFRAIFEIQLLGGADCNDFRQPGDCQQAIFKLMGESRLIRIVNSKGTPSQEGLEII
jgi:hypothetical protein